MTTDPRPAYEISGDFTTPLVATAIHTGHDLRPEVAAAMILPEADRLREEDPFTHLIGAGADNRIVVHRSRFEVDLNRPRDMAVYRTPEQRWGLDVWRDGWPADDLLERSLAEHDDFYAALAEVLDPLAARGRFVVYDVHSYNHRRPGPDAEPQPVAENPEVNVGTNDPFRELFAPVVDACMASLASVETSTGFPDVRENVKFRGGYLNDFVHARYPGVGYTLSIEFKKTFMDEWTGVPDEARIAELRDALTASHAAVLDALSEVD